MGLRGGAFYQLGLSMSFFVGVTVGGGGRSVRRGVDSGASGRSGDEQPVGTDGRGGRRGGNPGRTRAGGGDRQTARTHPGRGAFTILTAPYLLLLFGRGLRRRGHAAVAAADGRAALQAVTTYRMWGLRGRKRPRDVAIVQILLAVVTVGLGAMVAGQWGLPPTLAPSWSAVRHRQWPAW